MKLFAIFIILVLIVGALGFSLFCMQDRDSRIFKKATKLLRPYLETPIVDKWIDLPFQGSLRTITRDKHWQWYQPKLVQPYLELDKLHVEVLKESVWWKNWRGPMLYSYVKGDVDVQITVNAHKASNPECSLDRAYQFGGIILRDPLSNHSMSSENYVFNVVGHRGGNGFQVETKSTMHGWSIVQGHDWKNGNGELRIRREGSTFELFARKIDTNNWDQLAIFNRPDLPEVLEIGIIAYAYDHGSGYSDLKATFSNLLIN